MLGLEEIIGLELISSDAKVIGTIEGVGMDLKAWKLKALKIGLRRGMEEAVGSKRRFFGVNKIYVKTTELQSVSDAVIMRRPVSALGEILEPEGEHLIPAGKFMGMRVICSNATFLGNVDNVFVDTETEWSIPYIQVKLDRDAMDRLSLQRTFMASSLIPIRTRDVEAIGEMVILSISVDELRAALNSGSSPVPLGGQGSSGQTGPSF
ncbi:MAG: PRC-barrel domain-containing protein [Methanomassiliicoccus sp.]|nr:PRC-barrel domain-containing protein [Methanomassiliicoccus sp.]